MGLEKGWWGALIIAAPEGVRLEVACKHGAVSLEGGWEL